MQYHRIPHSSLEVSVLGLGTMTFGEQNSEADAHAQLDYALAAGVNLIDTAELYPVPPRPEIQGLTESYIGSWLKARGNREKIVLASKVSGPVRGQQHSPAAGARSQKHPRRAGRQPQAAEYRLSRSLPIALAAARHQLFWQTQLSIHRRQSHGHAAGNAGGADRAGARRQDPLYRGFQ